MKVADTEEELRTYISEATSVSREYPVVVSKFFDNAKEVEVDGVSNGKGTIIGFVLEHVDPAGVHSGDATVVTPATHLSTDFKARLREHSRRIATELRIRGTFNIQYLVVGNDIYVIECNSRSSRSMPFVSKVYGINIMEEAAKVALGSDNLVDDPPVSRDHIMKGVKFPKFSFVRLAGARPVTGVEMMSTGEVASIGEDFHDAFEKAMYSANPHMNKPSPHVVILCNNPSQRDLLQALARDLDAAEARLSTLPSSREIFDEAGVPVNVIDDKAAFDAAVIARDIDCVIDIPWFADPSAAHDPHFGIMAAGFDAFIITNSGMAKAFAKTLKVRHGKPITITPLKNYTNIV